MTAKKTPLYSAHQALNAQFVEFASTLLPVRFHSEKEEHLAVRQAVGIFDVSHMGEFFVSGKNAASFLDHLLTNNVNRLSENEAQYSLLLNEQGGIIDDLIIYRQRNGQFLLCVNAANIERDWQHISREKRSVGDVEIENASHRFAQIAVQGKKASELLRLLTKSQLPARFHIVSTKLNSIETLVARTGYTGEDGFEIFLSNVDAEHLWQILLEHGQALGIKPCGLAARDSLRLEAGLLLHGQDMDETTTPIEAGLMFAVDMNKKNFIGKDALIKQKARGISKKLMGIRLLDRGLARHGYKIFNLDHHEIGEVTSGGLPPGKDNAIGLCYIAQHKAKIGDEVLVDIRGRLAKAELVRGRFIFDSRGSNHDQTDTKRSTFLQRT